MGSLIGTLNLVRCFSTLLRARASSRSIPPGRTCSIVPTKTLRRSLPSPATGKHIVRINDSCNAPVRVRGVLQMGSIWLRPRHIQRPAPRFALAYDSTAQMEHRVSHLVIEGFHPVLPRTRHRHTSYRLSGHS